MQEKNHLPLFGVGPVYAAVVIALTVAAAVISGTGVLASGQIARLRMVFTVAGILFIAAGVLLWVQAVIVAKIDSNIEKNRLVTTGVYAWVRNPIYSAIMIACTGVILIAGNAWFFVLPLFFWLFMTVLMKNTEEKWLLEKFGSEYAEYMKRVNRCWPWPPKLRR